MSEMNVVDSEIFNKKGFLFAECYGLADEIKTERAAELVRRWNAFEEGGSHDALLSACEKISVIKQWIMRVRNAPKSLYEDIEEVEAAIAAGKE